MSHYIGVAGADIEKGQPIFIADNGLIYPGEVDKDPTSIPSDSWKCCGMTMRLDQKCKVCGDPSD